MADVTSSIIPVLIIPLLLIISVAVYTNTAENSAFVFENTITNESSGVTGNCAAQTWTSDRDCEQDSVTAVYNGTHPANVTTNYNVTYQPLGTCNFTTNVCLGAVSFTYTGMNGTGYTAFDKVNTNTFSGYKLASVLPYTVIAMAVLAIVVGALVIR